MIDRFVRGIALVQALGALAALYVVLQTSSGALGRLLTTVFAAALLCASLFVWRRHPAGYGGALMLQALQVVKVSSDSFSYFVSSGLQFVIGVAGDALAVTVGLSTGVYLAWSRPVDVALAGVNVVPLAFVIVLWRARVGVQDSRATP